MDFWVTEFKAVNDFLFVWCRHVMTSCHDVTNPALSISVCGLARTMILFMFPWYNWLLILRMLSIMYFCDDITSQRHVMTSRHYLAPQHLSYLVVGPYRSFLLKFHGNLGCWYLKKLSILFLQKWPPACHNVASWRHVVTSSHHMKLKQ